MMLGLEHLTPWDLADEDHERIAPMCPGPGHRIGTDKRGFDVRIEDCPTCVGRGPRNHREHRREA